MSAVSFIKNAPSGVSALTEVTEKVPTPVVGVAVDSTTTVCETLPASTANMPVAASRPSGLVLGDKIPDFSEIVLPRINLAQQIGELKDSFAPGSVVFNQTTALFTPPVLDKSGAITTPGTPPVQIVCLGFRPTRFVEKVVGGFGGAIVSTEAEVRANGGTLDYQEHKLKSKDGMKLFQQLAEALIAIERPAHINDDDNVFVYPVEGKKFALALWAMKGTAFTSAAKKVFFTNRAIGCLRKGYPSRVFSMSTRWQSYDGGNGAWIPVLIPGAATSLEFLAWVAGVLNPDEAPAE